MDPVGPWVHTRAHLIAVSLACVIPLRLFIAQPVQPERSYERMHT